MGLVDDEQGKIWWRRGQRTERSEGRNRDATTASPACQGTGPIAAVECEDPQAGVPRDLPGPVDEHAGGTDHQKVAASRSGKMGHCGNGLDRLSQAHLIAENDPPLHEGEPGAERLIATQPEAVLEPGCIEPLGVDPLDDVGRQEPLGRGDIPTDIDQLAEQSVIPRRVTLEVTPYLGGTGYPQLADLVLGQDSIFDQSPSVQDEIAGSSGAEVIIGPDADNLLK
jgi:hypothetical protein